MTVHIIIPSTPERRERLARCISSVRVNAGYPHIISVYENQLEGYIKAIRKMLEGLRPDTLVWCLSDDMVLIQKNVLGRLMGVFEKHPRNVAVQANDNIGRSVPLLTSPLCEAQTMLEGLDDRFYHNYCDVVFTERMLLQNRYIFCKGIVIDHEHWCNGKAGVDLTYEAAGEKYAQDRATYDLVMDELGLERTIITEAP